MRKLLFILTFLLFTISYSQSQFSTIYAIGRTNNQNFVEAFDYINQSCDTLFYFQFLANNLPDIANTFDPFRKIIYYCTGYYRIIAIDIINHSTYEVASLSNQIDGYIINIQYDFFSNSLLIHDFNNLINYNLTNNSLTHLTNIYFSNSLSTSTPRSVYNQLLKQFYSMNSVFDSNNPLNSYEFSMTVNGLNNNAIDTVILSDTSIFGGLVYNLLNNNYYAYKSNNILKISPTGQISNLCSINDFTKLNSQQTTFDYIRGNYLIPIYYNGKSYLDVYNVNNCNHYTIPYTKSDYQYFSFGFNPILVFNNNTLLSTFCNNYSWYFNNNIIHNFNSQSFIPQNSGNYKVANKIGDSTYFSNEIFINVKEKEINFSISPNPAKDYISIKYFEIISSVEIFDIMGNLLVSTYINDYECKLNISTLTNGLYIFKIKTENNSFIEKILKE